MAGARFYAKPYKDEVQIFLFLTYKRGERLRYYTGKNVPVEFWDTDKQRVKASRFFPQYSELNAILNDLANEAERIKLRFENEKSLLTNEIFKTELNRFRDKSDSKETRLTFFRFFENFIKKREGNHKYSKGSITVYKTTLSKVREFDKDKHLKLDFHSFTEDFFVDFTTYLFSQRYGSKGEKYSQNYVHKITSTLNTVLRDAERLDVSPNLRCKTGWLQVSKQEVEKIYLTLEELNTMWSLDLSRTDGLERVRDLFLIGACTGLRFSDYSQINSEDIHIVKGSHILKIVTQKTRKAVEVPLNPLVLEILKKYGGVPPKAISNAKTNEHLKVIGKLAGITENVTITTFGEGRKRITKTFPKYELITTHTARRSFATNAYKEGASIVAIMKITGHKTETEFLKYIRLSNEEHALQMAENSFFKTWNFEKKSPETEIK
jgi:integrase